MISKNLTIPVELYSRLRELVHLAPYRYEENNGSDWNLSAENAPDLRDESGRLSPDAFELYFELLPHLAKLFVQQNPQQVTAYKNAPKPAAVKPSVQLIPLEKVPEEHEKQAREIEEKFYAGVPESERVHHVLPGVMDHMLRHDLSYSMILDILHAEDTVMSSESAAENRYGRAVTLYSNERIGYVLVMNAHAPDLLSMRPWRADALIPYHLTDEALEDMARLGLTIDMVRRIPQEAQERYPVPGTAYTLYYFQGYSVKYHPADSRIVSIAEGLPGVRNPLAQPKMRGVKRQPARKIPSDVSSLKALLEEHGFTVAMGGKHYDVRHPVLDPALGKKVTTSITPSDSQRWHLNTARQIRQSFGLDLRYANPEDSRAGIVRDPKSGKVLGEFSAPNAQAADGAEETDSQSS